ncbi:MAG: bifunctional (p)ppGpp synthetase/guanosine-3',5'-bis(diphosphate) 3'-pyrophosphohydrolase [Candidatus Aminicenantes bacterium]
MIRFNDILEKVSRWYTEKDLVPFQKAYVFAAQAHKGQVRRSGEPYLSHPLEVANILADMKLDAVTLSAGLLHDVLEDTDVTAPELHKIFGKDIAHLVEGVTKIGLVEESSPETRHAETIRKIILAMTDDLRVIFIKLADRIHNLQTLKFLPENKQRQIARETLDIYAPIANRLGMGKIKAELEDLSFKYVDTENHYKILSQVKPKKKESAKELQRIKKSLTALMQKHHIPVKIYSRIKRPYSIYSKMQRQNIEFDQVYDFVALRLITDSVENCYSALGIIHQKWTYLPSRFHDFISMPKPNLYQALHTTILTEKKMTMEIQIRTRDMHNLALAGIAAHWKYKETDSQSMIREDNRLQWLRDMVDLYKEQKNPREFLKNLKTNLIPEEVYVFTPKGKVISLPMGATALDFAFKIHSEIGLHAAEAKIDGQKASLKTILKPGNIVTILTADDKTPSRDWLNAVFTSKARHHITRWLNQQEKKKNKEVGKKIWERKLSRHKIRPGTIKKKELLKQINRTAKTRISSMDDFYIKLGIGKIVLNEKFLSSLFGRDKMSSRPGQNLMEKVAARITRTPDSVIQVKDMPGSILKMGKCCRPIKGEPIVGYITRGKGITIHSRRCPLVKKEVLSPDRMMEAEWGNVDKQDYQARLLIHSKDSPGLLARLSSSIAETGGNITRAHLDTLSGEKSRIKLIITVQNIQHLTRIIKSISSIEGLYSVDRL